MTAKPTLLLSRRRRQPGIDWSNARSWLGGAPRLGNVAWPRGEDGRPFHHAAQIDLAEIAARTGATGLPATGALAFFIGREGAVVYVPDHMSHSPASPPADTPDLSESCNQWRADLAGRPLFPFWPLDFTVLDVPYIPEDEDFEHVEKRVAAQVAEVKRHFTRRQYNLSPEQAFFGAPIPDWWQTAIHYTDGLTTALKNIANVLRDKQGSLEWSRKKLEEVRAKDDGAPAAIKEAEKHVAMYEAWIAKLTQLEPDFRAFVAEAVAWTGGRDPWSLMTAEEVTHLVSLPASGNPKFHDFTSNHAADGFEYLKEKMLKALPVVGDPAFTALPETVRTVVNDKRAPRPQWWYSAIYYSQCLQEAARSGVPPALKRRQERLEFSRKELSKLQPKGTLATLMERINGKSKQLDEAAARVARDEAELAQLTAMESDFRRFVDDTADWTKGHDPWAFMETADAERLESILQRAKQDFDPFTTTYASRYITVPETTTLVVLASAETRAYATLPAKVRTFINETCLLPPNVWHQMFGEGLNIQTAASDNAEEGNHLLLQLTYDDMMFWRFGDNGAYQFWISPENLAQQNWAAVNVTIECH